MKPNKKHAKKNITKVALAVKKMSQKELIAQAREIGKREGIAEANEKASKIVIEQREGYLKSIGELQKQLDILNGLKSSQVISPQRTKEIRMDLIKRIRATISSREVKILDKHSMFSIHTTTQLINEIDIHTLNAIERSIDLGNG